MSLTPEQQAQVEQIVEQACKYIAWQCDGAIFPDAYSEDEVLHEREKMRHGVEIAYLAGREVQQREGEASAANLQNRYVIARDKLKEQDATIAQLQAQIADLQEIRMDDKRQREIVLGKVAELESRLAAVEPFGYVSTHTDGRQYFSKDYVGVYRDTAVSIDSVYIIRS